MLTFTAVLNGFGLVISIKAKGTDKCKIWMQVLEATLIIGLLVFNTI